MQWIEICDVESGTNALDPMGKDAQGRNYPKLALPRSSLESIYKTPSTP
jgi:hypothetical protein